VSLLLLPRDSQALKGFSTKKKKLQTLTRETDKECRREGERERVVNSEMNSERRRERERE